MNTIGVENQLVARSSFEQCQQETIQPAYT